LGSVIVLYFAGARDAVGKKKELLDLDGRATAGEMLNRITKMHPALLPMKGSLRLSVNQEVVGSAASVVEGDELGVLPPVAGG
jgi:molybdopterin converting factor small subunit